MYFWLFPLGQPKRVIVLFFVALLVFLFFVFYPLTSISELVPNGFLWSKLSFGNHPFSNHYVLITAHTGCIHCTVVAGIGFKGKIFCVVVFLRP